MEYSDDYLNYLKHFYDNDPKSVHLNSEQIKNIHDLVSDTQSHLGYAYGMPDPDDEQTQYVQHYAEYDAKDALEQIWNIICDGDDKANSNNNRKKKEKK